MGRSLALGFATPEASVDDDGWHDVGAANELAASALREVQAGHVRIALVHREGQFSAISGVCNHVGGPLGQGSLDGDYVVCPWHHWKFHRQTGEGEPGYEADRVPSHEVKVANGRVLVQERPLTPRGRLPHAMPEWARAPARGTPGGPPAEAPMRVLGISTTAMDDTHPRYSTSDALLEVAMTHAREKGAESRLVRLNELRFRSCEGYYSKSARACTWPCSITQMDSSDQLDRIYEGMVAWADVIVLATPIRWGNASGLYYKMAERLNCVQNQVTIANRVLMKNKVAAFIVTGGQDNVQGVIGQLLTFFAELGCVFPQFPFVGHSRGWSAEDMERNVEYVAKSTELREGTQGLVERALEMAHTLVHHQVSHERIARGGRKAHQLDVKAQLKAE
jgi:multimeric flavodoxin WrbA/nitrite reductase/ring-hydroxylating ferredoxin subunit